MVRAGGVRAGERTKEGGEAVSGEMYSWVTKTWTPIGGECPIACPYCYVRAMAKRFPALAAKYSGEPRLTGPWPRFRAGDVVFVCHMTDLFAMPPEIVTEVLRHCRAFPDAEYAFQTKVPGNVLRYDWHDFMPLRRMIGTTIETDLPVGSWVGRATAMGKLRIAGERTFVTVEPIKRFSSDFADILVNIGPAFVNIGADSKRSGLEEPTADEVRGLIADLRNAGIEVRIKPNLYRIIGKEVEFRRLRE